MKKILKIIFILLFLPLLISGCTQPPPPLGDIQVLEGPKELPSWVFGTQGETISKTQKTFVGYSRKHETFNDAIRSAELDAKVRAVEYIYGTYLMEKGKSALVEAGLTADVLTGETAQKVIREWQTKGIVIGNAIATIWQKVRERTETGKYITYYRAFVRYAVDIETVKNVMKEILNKVKEEEKEESAREKIDRGLKLIDELFSSW
jgi:uncharacterized protein YoaH (UPF0181 family)